MEDRKAVVGLALALAVALAAIFLVWVWKVPPPQPPPKPPTPKIVVVPVDFVLASPDADMLVERLVKVAQREDVAGFILLVNSPGGTVSATEMLYQTLRGINKTKYAVVYGLAASGAYYISVAADEIYATPSSWVGSIGVIAVMWPDDYLYDLPDYIYTTGPLKYYGRDLTDYYNDIERIRLNFVKAVLEGRRGKIKADPKVFETASVFTATEALGLGLVDKIGGLLDTAADMASRLGLKNYSLVYLGDISNFTSTPSATWRVSLNWLLNVSSFPIFYIMPTAVQWTVSLNNATRPPAVAAAPAEGPYVVIDMAHDNMVPRGFVEILRAELAKRGYKLVPASTEAKLAQLLANATGLVVVNPVYPFSADGAKAVFNATRRGVRVLYFYDMRASAIVTISGVQYIAPYSIFAQFDSLPMYFNMSGLRAVYNFTSGGDNFGENWAFVTVYPNNTWRVLDGVAKLVLFSPSAVAASSNVRLDVRGFVFGYGVGDYTVAAQAGNFTFVGAVRSFTPYFITMGDNWKFFSNLVGWLVEPRQITPGRITTVPGVIYASG